ncbi:MAG: hypothetical protein ACOYXT_17185 [Bacteroidota bacterium]
MEQLTTRQSAVQRQEFRKDRGGSFQVEDHRPEAASATEIRRLVTNSPQVLRAAQWTAIANKSSPCCANQSPPVQRVQITKQPGKTKNQKPTKAARSSPKRPRFPGYVKKMREKSIEIVKQANDARRAIAIHMAHRVPWDSIREIIGSGKQARIDTLIEALTVPKRDFGDPAKLGVAANDPSYHQAIMNLIKKHGSNSEEVLTALNASPYNLKPGDGIKNSAIGAGRDPHFDESKPNKPMTPTSKSMADKKLFPDENKNFPSSDMLTMGEYSTWEENFKKDYLQPAIDFVNRL